MIWSNVENPDFFGRILDFWIIGWSFLFLWKYVLCHWSSLCWLSIFWKLYGQMMIQSDHVNSMFYALGNNWMMKKQSTNVESCLFWISQVLTMVSTGWNASTGLSVLKDTVSDSCLSFLFLLDNNDVVGLVFYITSFYVECCCWFSGLQDTELADANNVILCHFTFVFFWL